MATKSRKVTTKMKKIALGNKNAPIALSNVFWVCVSVLLYRTNDAKQMRGGGRVCRAVLRWDNCPHNTS